MGDTIPNCEFMHAHEEIIEKVNASMPDVSLVESSFSCSAEYA